MNAFVLIDQIIVSGSRFLLSIILARSLGINDFGLYALLWTIVSFASAMQVPVAIVPMMQLGPQVAEHRQSLFFTSAFLFQLKYTAVCIPFVSFATLFIVWGQEDIVSIVLLINIYIAMFNLYEYLRRHFFSKGFHLKALTCDAILYSIILGLITGYTHFNGLTITTYCLYSSIVAAIVCIILMRDYDLAQLKLQDGKVYSRRIWAISSPLIFSTLASVGAGHIFVYSTAIFLGQAEVGGIVAARNIVGPLVLVLVALENSMTRELVLLKKNDPARISTYTNTIILKWLVGFLLSIVVLSFFSKPLLRITYGEDFVGFASLIYWFGGASILALISKIHTIRLRADGKYAAIKKANIWAMLFALVTSPFLVYMLGINGAGLSVFSTAASLVFSQIIFARRSGISLLAYS